MAQLLVELKDNKGQVIKKIKVNGSIPDLGRMYDEMAYGLVPLTMKQSEDQ